MLTTDAINDFKDFIDNIIAYAKVTVNGVSEKKVIHRRERLKDGRVAVYVQIRAALCWMRSTTPCSTVRAVRRSASL